MTDAATTNTICPVCGLPIAGDMPPVSVDPQYRGHQHVEDDPGLFRVCCAACARMAALDPKRYRIAAQSNLKAPQSRGDGK
jgi:hypothetical protein